MMCYQYLCCVSARPRVPKQSAKTSSAVMYMYNASVSEFVEFGIAAGTNCLQCKALLLNLRANLGSKFVLNAMGSHLLSSRGF